MGSVVLKASLDALLRFALNPFDASLEVSWSFTVGLFISRPKSFTMLPEQCLHCVVNPQLLVWKKIVCAKVPAAASEKFSNPLLFAQFIVLLI